MLLYADGKTCSALYLRGDPYETSDAVFGVKESLIIDLQRVGDVDGLAEKHGVPPDTKLLQYDFVLITDEQQQKKREEDAWREVERQGGGLDVIDGALTRREEK